MVDLVPATLLVYGLVSAGKPEWIASIDRYLKSEGTPELARDVTMSPRYFAMLRITGVCLTLFGLFFTVRSF